MEESVTFEHRRFDPDQNAALTALAKQGAQAFGYTARTLDLDVSLAQLLRLRVSQLNHCTFCMALHYEAARKLEIPRAKIDTLTAWRETALFTEAEQAALAYTEALTRVSDAAVVDRFEQYHQALTPFFSERQISDIAGVVINMNIWTRLKLAAGSMPRLEPSTE